MKNITKDDMIMNAGRIINLEEEEILQELARDYVRNIFNLISKLKYKIVVFDFDGTLTRFQYAANRILPCDEADLYEYSKTHNIYENAKIIKTFQYVMSQLESEDLYIITNSVETIKDKKDALINATCKYVPKSHVIHTTSKEDKLAKMKEIHEKTGKQIIFVEDMAPNIQLMEENTDFIQGFHISSLLA